MKNGKGLVVIGMETKVWYVWFPGEKKRQACYPIPDHAWERMKAKLVKDGYEVLTVGLVELPEPGSS